MYFGDFGTRPHFLLCGATRKGVFIAICVVCSVCLKRCGVKILAQICANDPFNLSGHWVCCRYVVCLGCKQKHASKESPVDRHRVWWCAWQTGLGFCVHTALYSTLLACAKNEVMTSVCTNGKFDMTSFSVNTVVCESLFEKLFWIYTFCYTLRTLALKRWWWWWWCATKILTRKGCWPHARAGRARCTTQESGGKGTKCTVCKTRK